jgi:hypothetical protein
MYAESMGHPMYGASLSLSSSSSLRGGLAQTARRVRAEAWRSAGGVARARALPAAGPLASPLLQAGEEKPKIGGYSPPSSLGLSVGESPPLIC